MILLSTSNIKKIEKEIFNKVLDTLMSTGGRPLNPDGFVKKIEKELFFQFDIETAVDKAYLTHKKMNR